MISPYKTQTKKKGSSLQAIDPFKLSPLIMNFVKVTIFHHILQYILFVSNCIICDKLLQLLPKTPAFFAIKTGGVQ